MEKYSTELRVNNGRTPVSLQGLNVLDETNRLSISASQSELMCKSLKRVRPGGAGRGGAGRTVNRKSMMDVPQHPCTGSMYSTSRVDSASK